MNKSDCADFKKHGMWKPSLCRVCIGEKCPSRLYSYDVCKPRERNRKVRYCYEIIKEDGGQYVWDFFRHIDGLKEVAC